MCFSGNVAAMDSTLARQLTRLVDQIATIIVGKRAQIEDSVACLLAGGHLLIEDVPGVGKTTLAHTLAVSLGLEFRRVQFTADLMPSDLVGVTVYERSKEAFVFHPGPVFAQVLLADEINRAGPKTQSALLEAMEEQQVSVDNDTRALPKPFFVIATQNPSDQLGTYPLPESQLDRFLLRITLGYPDRASERALLAGADRRESAMRLQPVLRPAELIAAQQAVLQISASEALLDYLQALIAATARRPLVRRRPVAARRHRGAARGAGARADGAARLRGAGRHPGHPAAGHRPPPDAGARRRPRRDRAGARDGRGHADPVTAPAGLRAGLPRPPGPSRLTLRRRLDAWWQSRLPLTDTWQLGQRNIYIVPTRGGLSFAALLIVMLLSSINYQLNLGYVLTFLLGGSAIVSMHMTHGTLRGLTLRMRPGAPVFAGDPALLEVVFTNPGRTRYALAVRLHDRKRFGTSFVSVDVPAQGQASATVSIVPDRRGLHAIPALVVETGFPFGLFRAWTVWRPASRVLAWPRPEEPAPPLPASQSVPGEQVSPQRAEGSEIEGVRAWRRGDSLRQVVWKKVAHSGELVSRETSSAASRELSLDWSATVGGDVEQRLSRLAAWVELAERSGLAYGLRLPGVELKADHGDAHRRQALERLALWN